MCRGELNFLLETNNTIFVSAWGSNGGTLLNPMDSVTDWIVAFKSKHEQAEI